MSEVLGYLVLALSAAAFVVKTAGEIHAAASGRPFTPLTYGELRELQGFAAIQRPPFSLRGWLRTRRRRLRQALCSLIHGGHELYRARTDSRLYQQCLLCGYETHGWTIDRRDRRLHLVSRKDAA